MNDAIETAVEAGAKAFHDATRAEAKRDGQRTLRWETSSEQYRADIRKLVRPVVVAAVQAHAAAIRAQGPGNA